MKAAKRKSKLNALDIVKTHLKNVKEAAEEEGDSESKTQTINIPVVAP